MHATGSTPWCGCWALSHHSMDPIGAGKLSDSGLRQCLSDRACSLVSTSVLTSSGIASIQNSYFEAAATLGASGPYTILRVGIPAAMPHMFIGLFNGTTSSFITLVTAEMLGAKYGIGWYINWAKGYDGLCKCVCGTDRDEYFLLLHHYASVPCA